MIKGIFTLFNLQGTARKLSAFAVSLLIISCRFVFVKNFFQNFLGFSEALVEPLADLMNSNTSSSICQELFSDLPKNFHASLLSRILRFFLLFSPNFIGLCLLLLPLSQALGYTITHIPICQHLFSCFFKKLHSVLFPSSIQGKRASYEAPLSYYIYITAYPR